MTTRSDVRTDNYEEKRKKKPREMSMEMQKMWKKKEKKRIKKIEWGGGNNEHKKRGIPK